MGMHDYDHETSPTYDEYRLELEDQMWQDAYIMHLMEKHGPDHGDCGGCENCDACVRRQRKHDAQAEGFGDLIL